jgi:hypothetical protein
MKVICIRGDVYNEVVPSGKYSPPMPRIKEGSICTVIDESNYEGMRFYMFAEYYDVKYRFWYPEHDFIPLSEKDETTFERNILINKA